jgi:hypothetical protein
VFASSIWRMSAIFCDMGSRMLLAEQALPVSIGVSFARSYRTAGALKPGFGLSGNVLIFSFCHPDRNRSSRERWVWGVASVRLLNALLATRILHQERRAG